MAQENKEQTAGRDQLGDFAPKFAELNDRVLGEVWNRTDRLGLRDRSLVTVASLLCQSITDSSLTYHLRSAGKNGITRTEIAEIGEPNTAYASCFTGRSYLAPDAAGTRKRVTVRWRFFPARSSTFRPIRSTGTTADDTWFDHLAVEVPGRNTATEWLGPVTGPNTIGSGLNRSSAIESFPRCCGGWNGIRCPRTTQTGYAK